MKRLSLQWRITLMSVLLIGITCVAMNLLLCSSGVYYMDTIADSLQGGGTVILNDGGAAGQSSPLRYHSGPPCRRPVSCPQWCPYSTHRRSTAANSWPRR